jgi:tetratricopeptide (TPR) repeat protein
MTAFAILPFAVTSRDNREGDAAMGFALFLCDWLRECAAEASVLLGGEEDEDSASVRIAAFTAEPTPESVGEIVARHVATGDTPEFDLALSGVYEEREGGVFLAATVVDLRGAFVRGRAESSAAGPSWRQTLTAFAREIAEAADLQPKGPFEPLCGAFAAWRGVLETRALAMQARMGGLPPDAPDPYLPALEANRAEPECAHVRDFLAELVVTLVLTRGHEAQPALKALETVMHRAGPDWRSQMARGALLDTLGEHALAARAYTQVLDGRSKAPEEARRQEAALSAGMSFNMAGRHAEAQRVLGIAMQSEAVKLDAIVHAGIAAEGLGENTVAERLWQRALELKPDHSHALWLLARFYRRKGDEAKAAARYGALVEAPEISRDAFADAAEYFVSTGRDEKSLWVAERFAQRFGGDAIAHLLLASALNRLGRHKRALKALEQAELCAGVDELADLLARQRRYALHPESEADLRRLAQEAIEGDAAAAARGLADLVKRFEDFWEAQFFLGVALRRTERYEEAIRVLERLRAARELPGVDKELTAAYGLSGNVEAALTAARRALELEPEDPGALGNYAGALLESGDVDEALRYARRAEAAAPDDDSVKQLMALIHERLKKRGLVRNMTSVFKEAFRWMKRE